MHWCWGKGREGRQVVARMFINTACSASNFVCLSSRVHLGGGGAVGWRGRGAVWREATGVRVGPEAQEKELGLCRDTVFNLAEDTIEGKVQSMYSWVPSAPPARRRTVWGSSSLPPSVGREGARKRRAACGASVWCTGKCGPGKAHRRVRLGRRGTASSGAGLQDLTRRGGSVKAAQDWSGLADPPPHPHPMRRHGSDLQNSGLFFSSAMVRKNAACVSSLPNATAPHSPPLAQACRHRCCLPV